MTPNVKKTIDLRCHVKLLSSVAKHIENKNKNNRNIYY